MDTTETKQETTETEFKVTPFEQHDAPGKAINKYINLHCEKGDIIILYFSSLLNLNQSQMQAMAVDVVKKTGCNVMIFPASIQPAVIEATLAKQLYEMALKQARVELGVQETKKAEN